jgi:hypothetical protein
LAIAEVKSTNSVGSAEQEDEVLLHDITVPDTTEAIETME